MVKQRQKLLSLVDIFHLRLLIHTIFKYTEPQQYHHVIELASWFDCLTACWNLWTLDGWSLAPPPKKLFWHVYVWLPHFLLELVNCSRFFFFFFLLPWFLHVNCNQWNNGSLIVIGDSNSHIEPFVVDMRIDLHNVLLYINVNINK